MTPEIIKIYQDYERGKARRRKLCRIAYKLDHPTIIIPMKKLIILAILALFLVGCARELCSAYTHTGVYYYQSGVIKKK
jgi:amino acid transporter